MSEIWGGTRTAGSKAPKVEIMVDGVERVVLPIVDGVRWETVRKGAPSKLTFNAMTEENMFFGYDVGNRVQLMIDGERVFQGFIFTINRNNNDMCEVIAYDQLRYLKAKDTYVYTNKTATEVIQMICKDFGLVTGDIADTGYKIKQRDEDGQTLFDIILNALYLTRDATGKEYVLYDDVGKITLKNIDDMLVKGEISARNTQNFVFSKSIDQDVYNKVRICIDNEDTNTRDMYVEQDSGNIAKWGTLQYYMEADKGTNAQQLAKTILKAKNRKLLTLRVNGVMGETNYHIRGGSMVNVYLDIKGDLGIAEKLLCNRVTHTFYADHHNMDVEFFNILEDALLQ